MSLKTSFKLPCDPIVYVVHNCLTGHSKLEEAFNDKKAAKTANLEDKTKFEDTVGYKRSLFVRNVMQGSALIGAASAFLLGYVSNIFHGLFHPFNPSFYTCLFLCLLTGHIIGMTAGIYLACCTREYFIPEEASGEVSPVAN